MWSSSDYIKISVAGNLALQSQMDTDIPGNLWDIRTSFWSRHTDCLYQGFRQSVTVTAIECKLKWNIQVPMEIGFFYIFYFNDLSLIIVLMQHGLFLIIRWNFVHKKRKEHREGKKKDFVESLSVDSIITSATHKRPISHPVPININNFVVSTAI